MKKQHTQVTILVLLVIFWALVWHFFISVHPATTSAGPEPTKAVQAESLLRTRFRRVRAEMDALYHYRTKPPPFDAHGNPFRIPGVTDAPAAKAVKVSAMDASQLEIRPPDFAESLLKSAISTVRIGGVVTLHGTIQLTLGGQLHREGDVFTANLQTSKTEFKPIRIRIRSLSEAAVVFALEDAEVGNAEFTVHLKEERR